MLSLLANHFQSKKMLGIILGTGMEGVLSKDELFGYHRCREVQIRTQQGYPSSSISIFRDSKGRELALFNRHGDRLRYPAHEIPHMANALALQKLNVELVVSLGTCGSLRSELKPGEVHGVNGFRLISSTLNGKDFHGDHLYPRVRESFTPLFAEGITYAEIPGPLAAQSSLVAKMQSIQSDVVGMTLASEHTLLREVGLEASAFGVISDSCVEDISPCWDDVPEIVFQTIGKVITWWQES